MSVTKVGSRRKASPRKVARKGSKRASKHLSPDTKGNKTSEARRIRAGGHVVTVTNPDKIYWPDEQITKGDLVDYYNAISKYILPYLRNRPQSLRRTPNGIRDSGFFHKDAGGDAPPWVDTVSLHSESAKKDIEYILCNNKATLLYLNNLGCIELNPWNSRVSKLDHPDYMVMDLDPSDNNTFDQVIDAALVVKEILDEAGAPAYCKTSGATGLHIYVPLKAQYGYDEIRDFAGVLATLARERLPKTTTTERPLAKRNGRIYLDYLQNKRGQTLASAYSARPKSGATVSAPLLWKEVKHGLHPSMFNIRNMGKRLARCGDLFHDVLTGRMDLRKCLKRLSV